ncbi:MAG TPA: sensor domain-containing diguanylate cyclase [Gammaproteobacteria bacterium]|nr:sensor domain-containing diguanylate cyclase [Gammaproteobacteria bacterium]
MKKPADTSVLSRTIASTATMKLAHLPMLDLLYTPIEERFERITRLARRALGFPVAAITLLSSEKQWFKSVSGWSISELPRDRCLCNLTLEANDLVAIPDTLEDSRTASHPLVTSGPKFRAYVGFPLTDGEELVAGTLCVFDVKPRPLSSGDRQTLLDLAAIAQSEIARDRLRSAHASLTSKLGVARREAMMDPLTRLWNRRGAMLLLESAFEDADRSSKPLTIALVDLDGFKQVNDTMGHQTGDEVLRKVAGRLVSSVRGHDVACRIGGDEFLLLIIDSDIESGRAITERVLGSITSSPIPTRDRSIDMTASVGFTVRKPRERASIDELLERADRALRQSKDQGRNRVRMAS